MGTTAKLAGRAMQTTHACNWATMKRKKKRKKKNRQRRVKEKRDKDLQVLQGKHKSTIKDQCII